MTLRSTPAGYTTANKATTARSNKITKKPMTASTGRAYWLLSVSRDHVISARSLGIVQACHGRSGPVQRMKPGDGIVFYSARHQIKGKDLCQRFTGIATIQDGGAYQEIASESFRPWRRHAKFEEPAKEVDLRTVLPKLACLHNGAVGWGQALRRGVIKIGESDWQILREAMVRRLEDEALDS
jgi:hypothetical protein